MLNKLAYFSSETMESRRQRDAIYKVMKEKVARILYLPN